MRIGCLQFSPQVGDVDNNLNRADAVLSKANPQNLDLLVLPELAFSGYNFKSLQHISPYLEPTTSGITSLWARTTALKYDCVVTVGYPEKVDVTPKWPASPEYYNSAITVNADGETIANYRKSFLYYTDERWALEGPDGFFDGEIEGLGNVAMGICKWPTKSFERMDLNPYKFEAPWSAWEFAYHILHKEANLVILSMAWLTRENARAYSRTPKEPDMDTLSYWLARLEPLIRAETDGEIIRVFANRTGTEGEATYAGTSAVLGIHSGEVKVYGILGRGERELLVVDTSKRPQAKLIAAANSAKANKQNAKEMKAAADVAKTNSTISTNSDQSANSAKTHITTPEVMESPLTLEGLSIEEGDIVIPLSPVDARSPSTFFPSNRRKPEESENLETLKSSIASVPSRDIFSPPSHSNGQPLKSSIPSRDFSSPAPQSNRRKPEGEEVRADLHSSISNRDYSSSPAPDFRRPASPKSRNCSRTRKAEYQEPALRSLNLADETQVTERAITVKSPVQQPLSASAIPDIVTGQRSPSRFGPRSLHISPRPKSTVW